MILLVASLLVGIDRWGTYTNVRYGYATCFPADILRAQPEADAGDGRKFVSADGAQLSVFGQWNVDHSSLSEWATDEAKGLKGTKGHITYRAARANWLVLSGSGENASEFYTKTIRRGDEEFVTMQFTYSAKRARFYRPIIERLSRCLRLTNLSE